MFRNYMITAVRNFARNRLYSSINIVGLVGSLICTTFIVLFLRDELSYDRWIPGTENLYRAEISLYLPGAPPIITATSPIPLGPAMKATIPDIVDETHITAQVSTIANADRKFSERIYAVDPDFFAIVRLPLIKGDAATVFTLRTSIVLSESDARKYFGDVNVIGRALTVDSVHWLKVTGVMRDLPHNTQLDGGIFIPNTSEADRVDRNEKANWFMFTGWTYVRLSQDANVQDVEERTRELFARQVPVDALAAMQVRANQVVQAALVRFPNVHLASDKEKGGMRPGGSWSMIYGFVAIAALILGIACFNFTNLTTARAMLRAREVALRKVMGAQRRQLIFQFLSESIMVTLAAAILALAFVEILTPIFDRFVDRPVAFRYSSDGPFFLAVLALALATGVLGGSYPAFILSGFTPAAALRTNALRQRGSGLVRSVLVITQFSIAIALGIATLVVFSQIRYARNVDLGFGHDHIIVVNTDGNNLTPAAAEEFVRVLRSNQNIAGAAQSNAIPFERDEHQINVSVAGTLRQVPVRAVDASPEFFSVYGMKLLAGRLLSRTRPVDISKTTDPQNIGSAGTDVVIDAMAAHALGFSPASAVGKTIKVGSQNVVIAGVVRNAFFHGTRIKPIAMIYYFHPGRMTNISVRTKNGRVREALESIDKAWNETLPSVAIRRHFLDRSLEELFAADKRRGTLFGIFAAIAIFIACLGLFGLAAFTAERRTREIGVRKAFGASTTDVVRLLLWQFSIPVLVANLIAWPVAWYYLHGWLEGYTRRITLGPTYFFAAGLLALAIAWATIFAHAVRVARAAPVHALRSE